VGRLRRRLAGSALSTSALAKMQAKGVAMSDGKIEISVEYCVP
jgi:hypothetical protein